MNKCLQDCNIEDKLSMCCGMHPETFKTKSIIINDKILESCPFLSNEGACTDYENRPKICKNYECPLPKEGRVYEITMENH